MARSGMMVCAIALFAGTASTWADEVTLIPQGLYVERGSDGTLNCSTMDRMRLELQLESEVLQENGTMAMERSSSGVVRFDTGAGEFMEVSIEHAVIAIVPGGRRIAAQGAHNSGGTVHFNGALLENGDIDLQSAYRLEGNNNLTTYVRPDGQPPEGLRPDGVAVGALAHCPGFSF